MECHANARLLMHTSMLNAEFSSLSLVFRLCCHHYHYYHHRTVPSFHFSNQARCLFRSLNATFNFSTNGNWIAGLSFVVDILEDFDYVRLSQPTIQTEHARYARFSPKCTTHIWVYVARVQHNNTSLCSRKNHVISFLFWINASACACLIFL